MIQPDLHSLRFASYAILGVGWTLFAVIFLTRKRPPKSAEQKRDRASLAGIAVQGVGFALVWTLQRPRFTPLFAMSAGWEIALDLLAACLMAGAVWLVLAAVRTLGRQWSLAARLVDAHQLVTDGPYRRVRHPIYAGMFAMLIATGVIFSHWLALAAAIPLFYAGTLVRTRIEDRLLRAQFGEAFEAYARAVPSLFPWRRGG